MAANPNHKKKSVVCKQITCHAAKSSITCLDWDPLNHKVIVTGSDDKTVKFWDIDQISSCNEKYIVNIDCSKYGEVTCVRLNDKLHKIWVATNDCNVYEFDTRNIKNNQVKCLCKCEDEINDIKYDSIKNCLLIGDDTGSITKYNLADDTSNSVKLHENSVCTSLALSNISAFSGGTDASILQFDSTLNAESMFDPIYCYSVTEMIENTSKNQSQNGASWINPPFVYSLDILPTDNIKSVYLSMALGNGSVAIFKPQLIEENTSNDKSEEKEKSKETDTDAPDEPVSFVSLHKQACCKAEFGRFNHRILTTVGSDSVLTINSWIDKNETIIINPLKSFHLPNNEKPNDMITTNNDKAKIVVANTSNQLYLYLWQ